jgi:hypothetical protein
MGGRKDGSGAHGAAALVAAQAQASKFLVNGLSMGKS